MPISSRRCGMITKREAERLVKSFLEDNAPPKLPDNFAFDVFHLCGWGSKGSFIPSRYNSSRAKCIKCTYCNMFFSPNKFIFHFHRTNDSNSYCHPDAANFNSWRRHLKLDNDPSDEMEHAWEDVKAMFNGGSRKRLISSNANSKTNNINVRPGNPQESQKRQRLDIDTTTGLAAAATMSYPYPMVPVTSNPMQPFAGLVPRAAHPAFPFSTDGHNLSPDSAAKFSLSDMWKGKGMPHPYYHPFGMLWANNMGLAQGAPKPFDLSMAADNKTKFSQKNSSQSAIPKNFSISELSKEDERSKQKTEKLSAFRPVNKDCDSRFNLDMGLKNYLDSSAINRSPTTSDQSSDAEEPINTVEDAGIINVTDVDQNEENRKKDDGNDFPSSTDAQQSHVGHVSTTAEPENTGQFASRDSTNRTESNEGRVNNNNCTVTNVCPAAPEDGLLISMTNDELQDELKQVMDARERAEMEYQEIQASLRESLKRDEVIEAHDSDQSKELERQMQARRNVQSKLKEAHQALSHFSSKMTSLKDFVDARRKMESTSNLY
ncbi:unnamed protein product [Owenia fusiformis]|uniref:c-SKI SMAD4-binding domain-containing protein n=1 Tax=Owenia fusiformis TaxID=6347 RepID=A0A8S4PQQ5_OWEFU|nr:unnamed protein product [Owenia fusiformis]